MVSSTKRKENGQAWNGSLERLRGGADPMKARLSRNVTLPLCPRFGFFLSVVTHQSVSRLVLINGADPGPIEVHQKRHARRVERVLRRHHPKEIWKAVAGEHRVRVCVAELQQNSYVGD